MTSDLTIRIPSLIEIGDSRHIGACANCMKVTICKGYGIVSKSDGQVQCTNTVCLCKICIERICRELGDLMNGE